MWFFAYSFRIMKNLPETAGSSYSAAIGLAVWETQAIRCGVAIVPLSRASLGNSTVNVFFRAIGRLFHKNVIVFL